MLQVYAVTGTGYTDGKNSHYTQFSGVLLRASQETFKAASRSLTEEEDVSIGEGSFRGFTPMRGFTPGPNGDISRRNSRKEPRRNNDVNKAMSPPPIQENPTPMNGHVPNDEVPARKEKKKLPETKEVNEESATKTENQIPKPEATNTLVDIDAPKEEKPQQSYLALTGLGGPEKKQEPKQSPGTQKAGSMAPNAGFYSFLKR